MPAQNYQVKNKYYEKKKPTLEELAKLVQQIKNGKYPSSFDTDSYGKLREVYGAIKRLEEESRQVQPKKKAPAVKKETNKTTVVSSQDSDEVVEIDLTYYDDMPAVEVESSEQISLSDALVYSLTNRGKVDMEYISSLTGYDYGAIAEGLKGSIFQNPETWNEKFSEGWETAEEYLSGNLMRKYRKAKLANTVYGEHFAENLSAIEKVMPTSVTSKEIYVSIGSPWVPTWVINDFINHLLDLRKFEDKYKETAHDEVTGSWALPNKSTYAYRRFVAMRHTYGTTRLNALQILEKTLNMGTVAVYDKVPSKTTKSGEKSVLNKVETNLAIEKQQLIIDKFNKWVWKNPDRKKALEDIFERDFGCYRARNFNGSFLTLPTLGDNVTLYPYQKDAVARILFSPNTLLAHDVGSGKTYVMAVAGMELKRMGLSNKNLYVVPNNIVAQWEKIFHDIYPKAKILCVTGSKFTPAKRTQTLEDIRDNDYDAIIMAYSCFDRIPISRRYYIDKIQQQIYELDKVLHGVRKSTPLTSRRRTQLSKELISLLGNVSAEKSSVFFDELGITRMFVDEAHNYKNVPLCSGSDRVLGLSGGGSAKCEDMLDKVRIVQQQNGGGGVVMATGTPITNSITDAFVMQMYLQNGELALLDLHNFDSWVGMFAERVTEFEIDVDTNSYRLATRYSKFHNLPELTALLSSIADFHQVDITAGIPNFDGYTDTLITKTSELDGYLKEISKRADIVRHGKINRHDDNMLKITTDGRKAALDIRLVNDKTQFPNQTKVAKCAENVYQIYTMTQNEKSTQLVFCDSSTPKDEFNVYDELKAQLINLGVNPSEIEYVHDATSDKARLAMFGRVCSGQTRVLLGSTFKLGTGVNVQDKLIAIHHLDVPWRPADMHQREGRILRQGNGNDRVFIYRYITEGSFDAYSWQLLETKQRFITGLLSGSMKERSGSDIEDTVLDYAEIKALAVGNPLVKERVETANELNRLYSLQRQAVEEKVRLESELHRLPELMEHTSRALEGCSQDLKSYRQEKNRYDKIYTKDYKKQLRKIFYDALCNNEMRDSEREIGEYYGFSVILPANMLSEKPYIILKREGRYNIYTAGEGGILIRIENFLENLGEHKDKLATLLADYQHRQKKAQYTLDNPVNYASKIERVENKLKSLDKKLGVKDNA